MILKQLRSFLIGRDALATELLLDQMIRLDRHGRTGQFMTGVSPVNCALWDLTGKALGQPVCRLLGGPTREVVPAYASMLGFSIEPDQAAAVALEYQGLGFTAQKWFFRHGPGDGKEGMAKNLAMAASVRDAVGDDYELMFDAFNGWTLAYATEMVRALEPIVPTWMEEPIPPEVLDKVKWCSERLRDDQRLEMDGGVSPATAGACREAGCDVIVAASALFGAEDRAGVIAQLRGLG